MKIKVTKRKVDIVLEAEKNGKTVRKESYEPSEAQKELEAMQRETRKEQQSEMASARGRIMGRSKGRRSLLTGAATGQEEKKTTLG